MSNKEYMDSASHEMLYESMERLETLTSTRNIYKNNQVLHSIQKLGHQLVFTMECNEIYRYDEMMCGVLRISTTWNCAWRIHQRLDLIPLTDDTWNPQNMPIHPDLSDREASDTQKVIAEIHKVLRGDKCWRFNKAQYPMLSMYKIISGWYLHPVKAVDWLFDHILELSKSNVEIASKLNKWREDERLHAMLGIGLHHPYSTLEETP